jgi:hypothetical protein
MASRVWKVDTEVLQIAGQILLIDRAFLQADRYCRFIELCVQVACMWELYKSTSASRRSWRRVEVDFAHARC